MNSPLATLREFRQTRRERQFQELLQIELARREDPIDFGPGFTSRHFGSGVGSNQPASDVLLRENVGVAGMATRAIANRIGSLDPLVKTSVRTSDGTLEDETLDDHILKKLLDRPHPNYDRFQLFWLAASHIVTTGEAYLLKVRNRMRVPMMLQPMPPGNVTPLIENGIITGYAVSDGKANSIPLQTSDVVRMWFPDPETMFSAEGYLGPNAAIADAQKFADQHLRSHYQNDATPKVMLKGSDKAIDPDGDQKGKYQNAWVKKFSKRKGTNPSAPMFLPPGWEPIIAAMASGADVTPLLDHWQSNQLMNFGVPPSVLGRVVSGDRSAAETNQFVMDLHTVLPIATLISGALTLQLAEDFDPNIWVEYDEFISADKTHALAKEAHDIKNKIKSPQQILAARDEDPEAAPWGEFPPGSLADTPYTGEERTFGGGGGGESVSDLDEPDDDDDEAAVEPDDDEPRARRICTLGIRATAAEHWTKPLSMARVLAREKKFVPSFSRALRRIFSKQRKDVLANLAEFAERSRAVPADAGALFDPHGWDELFAAETEPLREAAFLATAQESLVLLGLDEEFIFTDAVSQAIRLQDAQMVKLVNQTTARRIRKEIVKALEAATEEGETLKSIEKSIDEIFKGRRRNAATIARTEMHRATQSAQLESFAQAAVPFKTWLDARDSNVRETHFQESILPVPRNEDFVLPSGHRCQYPGDSRLPAEESINCRCDAAPVFGTGDEAPNA